MNRGMDEYTQALCRKVVCGVDQILLNAIGRAMGMVDGSTVVISTTQLAAHVRCVRQGSDTFVTYYFGERPILELHDLEFKNERRDDAYVLVAAQNYRYLV